MLTCFRLGKASLYLYLLIGTAPVLLGQKTSTWTGDGTDDNWTTTENWDTDDYPSGGDTAIIPEPFTVILDGDRSIGLFETKGEKYFTTSYFFKKI